ncbi:HAD family phosphatase [Patescibacteria group bacterium]|nr:HAD family phosphatase [Patescibacteria group bacterium]
MITTIIFDLSDVYLEGIIGSHKYFEKKLDIPVSGEYFYNEGFEKFMFGQITEDEYWRSVIKTNLWDIPVGELKNAARKNFTEIKGTREIIEKLKKEDYTLILLSNHGKEWVEYCERKYSYHKLFKHVIYSFQVGFTKPNKRIFLLTLKKLQVKPQECLFIDDYINNIITAEKLGFNVIQFTSAKNLEKKLKEFKIKIYT